MSGHCMELTEFLVFLNEYPSVAEEYESLNKGQRRRFLLDLGVCWEAITALLTPKSEHEVEQITDLVDQLLGRQPTKIIF